MRSFLAIKTQISLIKKKIIFTGSRKDLRRHLEGSFHHQEESGRHHDRGQIFQRDLGQRDRRREEQSQSPRSQRAHLNRKN